MDIQKAAIDAELPEAPVPASTSNTAGETQKWKPVEGNIDDELKEAGDEVTRGLREKQREIIDSLDLTQCVSFLPSSDHVFEMLIRATIR